MYCRNVNADVIVKLCYAVLPAGGWFLRNVDKVTEGVACRDRTDAVRDDNTDVGIPAPPAAQSGQPRTHEKADMAIISASFPG